jgi:pimeloyl-ACP methyl ester carboxylesterase
MNTLSKLKNWTETEAWEGFRVFEHEVDTRAVKIVVPENSLSADRWAWRTEFFGAFANTDIELLRRGVWLVYMDVQDHYGSPKAMEHFNQFYLLLTNSLGFARKSAMIGLSRGGLFAYHWAMKYPDRVACVYADNPVLDFKSWPGGRGVGPGSPSDWKKLKMVYGFASDEEAVAYQNNPVDQAKLIAEAKIPCLHVAGDADEVVPFSENTEIFVTRLKELGGNVELIINLGGLHHPHGLEEPTPIVEFIERYL